MTAIETPLRSSQNMTEISSQLSKLLPRIEWLDENRLRINGETVELMNQKLLQKILKIIAENNGSISQEKLIALLNPNYNAALSDRSKQSIKLSVLKNISRLRSQLRSQLTPQAYSKVEWFYFCKHSRTYRLFVPKASAIFDIFNPYRPAH